MNRLLNESWIEGLPDNIVENLEELNRYVVQRICERIKEIGDIGTSDSLRLKSAIEYAGADLDAIEREISRIMKMNQAEVQRIFEEVAAENIDFANTYYDARGMEKLRTYRSRANLTAFVESAKRAAMDGTANLSHTYMIGFKRGGRVVHLREYYITAVDRAVTFVQTGTVDYQTAMRSTVRDMARSGLRRVTFDSGYSRRLDSQARMNILEGVRRLNADMMEETGKEFGADGVEISVHGLCAPDHQPIQGRQYSNREYERLNERLQRPIGTMNCHHFATPIILGVSKPVHSARELAEINARSNAPVEYRGRTMTRYEASQKQRQLETAIRYAKDERDAFAAAGDKIGATQARKRSAVLEREYKSFCEQAGLTPRLERTRSMTGPTVEKVPKTLDKEQKTIDWLDGVRTPGDIVTVMENRGWFKQSQRYSASLDGADFDGAVAVYRGYEKFFDRYPQMAGKFLPVVCEDLSRGKAYAQASTMGGGISVNRKFFSNGKKLAEEYLKDVALHFHPAGTDWQSLVTHECGHGLDGFLTATLKSKNPVSSDMQKSVLKACGVKKSQIGDEVSIYASQNNFEFFSECLAEGLWSKNPRKVAAEFMKQLDKIMEGIT